MKETGRFNSKKKLVTFFSLIVSIFFVPTSLFAKVTVERIWSTPPDIPRSIQINPTDPDIMYVSVGKSGVYKSTNGGYTFEEHNSGLPIEESDGGYTTHLKMSTVNPDYMYVSFSSSEGNQIYHTDDGGYSWSKPSIMDMGSLIADIMPDNIKGIWNGPIAINPVDANTAITSGKGNSLQKTIDGGDKWEYSANGFFGGRAGIGSTSFSWDPGNQDRFALFLKDFGVVFTADGSSTFRNLNVPPYNGSNSTPVGALDPTTGSEIIVTAVGDENEQIIAVTRDEGENWSLIAETEGNYKFIGFHPQDSNIIYAGKFKSIDNGLTWKANEKDVVAVFQGDGDVVYAAEMEDATLTIYKSIDGGISWIQTYDTVDIGNNHFGEIVIDPDDQDRLYLAAAKGVYIWNGLQWVLKSNSDGLDEDQFGGLYIRCVTVDPNRSNVVYAGKWMANKGHSNGIFMSTDYGETWKNISYNLGHEFTPWSISVNPNTDAVYVGSSHGSWFLSSSMDM